jgi:hypothetical protein
MKGLLRLPPLWLVILLQLTSSAEGQLLTRSRAVQRLNGVQNAEFELKLGFRLIDGTSCNPPSSN